MKTNLYLFLSLLPMLSLVSCDNGERVIVKKSGDQYEEAFVKLTGGYSKANHWNVAKSFFIDIVAGKERNVRIYAPCKDEYRLVARYTNAAASFTAKFDAPGSSADFVVAIGDVLYSAAPGGQVSVQSPRLSDVKVSDTPLQWILAVENHFDAEKKTERAADQIDFDFNDLLIGLSSVATDDGVSLDLEPLACGDNQPFYIHIKTDDEDKLLWQRDNKVSDDCEFHQWFGIQDYTKGVNTGKNSGDQITGPCSFSILEAFPMATSGCHLDMPAYWTLSDYSQLIQDYKGNITDVWGIYITVGTFKSHELMKDNPDYAVIASKGAGSAPHMLLFPDTGQDGQWRWPCEGNSLDDCYPLFTDWVADPYHDQLSRWYEFVYTPGTTRDRY